MKNTLPWLFSALLALFLYWGNSYYQTHCGCNAVNALPAVGATTLTATSTLAIADGSAFKGSFNDNLRFGRSNYEHGLPLSAGVTKVFGSTADYLKAHADRTLKITGFYNEAEKNTSIYPNLGLARANHIKAMLTGLGAPASQIATDAIMQNDLTFVNDTLSGGAMYSFSSLVTDNTRLTDIEKRLRANPIILYFATNASGLSLTDQQRKDFSDLLYYLDNKKGAKATSTGHTDNKGSIEKNTSLSAERAAFVRAYLAKNGVNAEQIVTAGKGSSVPRETNDTEEGRAKNRRVEVGIE
ncbi:MAG: OmpA family protein [Saprospiraceae bacterium]|nr:OmpA family protein [Saprospiraceae bacterium]